MPARHKARKRALDVLFEADARSLAPTEVLAARLANPEALPIAEYGRQIVAGVQEHQERIDEILTTYSQGWMLERMPAVDRAGLRIGVWEILFNDEVPDNVAIDETVSLVKELSTDESPAFVNGLLARVKDLKPSLLA